MNKKNFPPFLWALFSNSCDRVAKYHRKKMKCIPKRVPITRCESSGLLSKESTMLKSTTGWILHTRLTAAMLVIGLFYLHNKKGSDITWPREHNLQYHIEMFIWEENSDNNVISIRKLRFHNLFMIFTFVYSSLFLLQHIDWNRVQYGLIIPFDWHLRMNRSWRIPHTWIFSSVWALEIWNPVCVQICSYLYSTNMSALSYHC